MGPPSNPGCCAHVQNIYVDSFHHHPHPSINTASRFEGPVNLLMATHSVNYFVPSSSGHSFCSQKRPRAGIVNFTEEQICWRSLVRILLLGIFLILFVFIVYKVIKGEVTERIAEREEKKDFMD